MPPKLVDQVAPIPAQFHGEQQLFENRYEAASFRNGSLDGLEGARVKTANGSVGLEPGPQRRWNRCAEQVVAQAQRLPGSAPGPAFARSVMEAVDFIRREVRKPAAQVS